MPQVYHNTLYKQIYQAQKQPQKETKNELRFTRTHKSNERKKGETRRENNVDISE